MKKNPTQALPVLLLAMCLVFVFSAPGLAEDYKALEGVEAVKTVFDFRDGNPESALIHAKLIHKTYKDKAINNTTGRPDFVVVFMDSAVKLLPKEKEGFSGEEEKILDEMDEVISAMFKAGIRLEICAFAADFYGVDLESISPEIVRVENGWISSMGFQTQGYSLVPVF
jgi:intracellular sulfur oxidation DsrE/DsrF family protein